MKYTVHCMEKVFYEVDIEAETPEEAIQKVKDHLPDYIQAINSEFVDFEAKNRKMSVVYVRTDDWGRDLYRSPKTGNIYANVDGWLYTITPDWGEPISRVCKLSEVRIIQEEQITKT